MPAIVKSGTTQPIIRVKLAAHSARDSAPDSAPDSNSRKTQYFYTQTLEIHLDL